MTIYLDTSVLVTALTHEPESHRVQTWLAQQDAEDLAISDWVATEFSSALSLKLRAGRIDAAARMLSLSEFRQLSVETFSNLAVLGSAFRTATGFVDQIELGLRGADALHLAIAAEHGAELCTRDQKMSQASAKLGIRTQLI